MIKRKKRKEKRCLQRNKSEIISMPQLHVNAKTLPQPQGGLAKWLPKSELGLATLSCPTSPSQFEVSEGFLN